MQHSGKTKIFAISSNCQVQIATSLFLPLRSIQIVRDVNQEYIIESVNFRLHEWKEFMDDVPHLLTLSNSLKKNKSLDFPPFEEIKPHTWEYCEFQTPRLVGKLIPFTSLFGTKETVLRLCRYTLDVWGRIHPSEVALDLWYEELLSLNERRKEIIDSITHLEQSRPAYSSKNPFVTPPHVK